MHEKVNAAIGLYKEELLHMDVYRTFSKSEKDAKIAKTLTRLTALESMHANLWGEFLDINGVDRPKARIWPDRFLIMLCKVIFGLAVTVKLIEHMEEGHHKRFTRAISASRLSRKENEIISKVRKSEYHEEARLEDWLVNSNTIFTNIRDVMFGMNDGLVELLAVTVGIAAALKVPYLVFVAGGITAVAGTLSMATGAYLSTSYERDISKGAAAARGTPTARSSGFYVGIFYLIGTAFPLAPFALGYSGAVGIVSAIILTSIVLTITSSMIALASDKSIIKSVAKTLVLSLGAAVATIILGSYVRMVFHITI
ncbi:MAG: VIT1/CCC1 transporter family protein [Candidatus Marsarchaeota archaeon]|jgi:VIT1/CCC1 family predicted Fe2+/Mn2+ transporter|nr:VIT1/CCC1 transporter family protein [Candidatus Marsarchaeota archaeon]MCL5111434.1 VIT1/CCC1 transporter family protein [Candidatus Marsarchaeota archaeon]